ncbi:MAG: hypothetical protein GF384_02620 [Elusimicrobia bacterium]|nr:hypothetical protein [Elusimicrobiota bacterium]MBD3411851.1 hypothetical protein [Elusimicrobiota bacterium]
MKRLLAVGCAVLVFSHASAFALTKGDLELGPSFAFVNADDFEQLKIGLDAGLYLGGPHQLNLLIDYQNIEILGVESDGEFAGLGYEYNFDPINKAQVPFVGGSLTFGIGDVGDLYKQVLAVNGGFKSLVSDRAAIKSELSIERYFGEDNIDDATSLSLRVGLIVFFTLSALQ